MSNRFYLGLDLGQSNDYTASAVLQRVDDGYQVRHLARVRGERYTRIVEATTALLKRPPLARNTTLVIDGTGVGRAITDMFHDAKLKPIIVTLHGGNAVTREGRRYNVPKRDVVSSLLAVFQQERLKIAESLPLAGVLANELTNFKLKINLNTGHDSYEAWRDGDHDDLVLAVAMATWWAEKYGNAAGWQSSRIIGGRDDW